MANSTKGLDSQKPRKPRPDFPLFPHATGRWAKKVRGKLVYFGRVADDPNGQVALAKWLDEKDDLLAGRTPRGKTTGLTIKDLLNQFRAHKKLAADSGEITTRTFVEYARTLDRIYDLFGRSRLVVDLTAQDFEQLRAAIGKTRQLSAMKTEIQKTRVVFNYAYSAGLIDRPVRYGPSFKAPSEKALRRVRGQNGPKMFEAAEIRALLKTANPTLHAMILMGINCGYGESDLATLPRSAVDLDGGWVTHARPKTGAPRR